MAGGVPGVQGLRDAASAQRTSLASSMRFVTGVTRGALDESDLAKVVEIQPELAQEILLEWSKRAGSDQARPSSGLFAIDMAPPPTADTTMAVTEPSQSQAGGNVGGPSGGVGRPELEAMLERLMKPAFERLQTEAAKRESNIMQSVSTLGASIQRLEGQQSHRLATVAEPLSRARPDMRGPPNRFAPRGEATPKPWNANRAPFDPCKFADTPWDTLTPRAQECLETLGYGKAKWGKREGDCPFCKKHDLKHDHPPEVCTSLWALSAAGLLKLGEAKRMARLQKSKIEHLLLLPEGGTSQLRFQAQECDDQLAHVFLNACMEDETLCLAHEQGRLTQEDLIATVEAMQDRTALFLEQGHGSE